jgi:hypothetical protein
MMLNNLWNCCVTHEVDKGRLNNNVQVCLLAHSFNLVILVAHLHGCSLVGRLGNDFSRKDQILTFENKNLNGRMDRWT